MYRRRLHSFLKSRRLYSGSTKCDRILTCGSLLKNNLNNDIRLCGWVSDRPSCNSFSLRDAYGVVNCICSHEIKQNIHKSVMEVSGIVAMRPSSKIERFYANGDIELKVHTINQLKSNATMDAALTFLSHENAVRRVLESSKFSYRTHTCGELRNKHVGSAVVLCGWLKFWRSPRFIVLEDAYGATQCILSDQDYGLDASTIGLETVLLVEGTVTNRPQGTLNKNMVTGEIEVAVDKIQVLNHANNLAFNVRQHQKITEKLSLQHRYLSIRFPEMQSNLRTRSTMIHNMRRFLIEFNYFVEVETPTLFCRTPGGAREFLVPTRHKGEFFCLVQSPQQFKQMLMVGGIDRYFQVARCYRDEATRPDRQPEFTQLDIELSFTKRDDVLGLVEELLLFSFPNPQFTIPFEKLTYAKALEVYGSDKPDIGYGLKLKRITDFLRKSEKSTTEGSCLVIPETEGQLSKTFTRSLKEDMQKLYPKVKLYQWKLSENINDFKKERINNVIADESFDSFITTCNMRSGDTLFLATGDLENVCLCLGICRSKIAEEFTLKGSLKRNINDSQRPIWVVDFPLFTKGENGELETCHHPFTAPYDEDIPLLRSNPLQVRALSYDLVIGGQEMGGGSVRVHSAQLQEKLLSMLNIAPEPLSHLLRALRSGCPPHAGVALGLDRLSMLVCGAQTIRDVIAFPKSHDGTDPLSGAPSPVSDDELKYYHIKVE